MAARRKPAVKKIKFELTRSGIAGIGIVCFCIFLWMFLLGVWTGQSLLLPSSRPEAEVARNVEPAATQAAEAMQTAELPHIEAEAARKVKKGQ